MDRLVEIHVAFSFLLWNGFNIDLAVQGFSSCVNGDVLFISTDFTLRKLSFACNILIVISVILSPSLDIKEPNSWVCELFVTTTIGSLVGLRNKYV